MDKVDRPFDLLNLSRGKEICVYLKEGQLTGILEAFDIHLNLVISIKNKPTFIRGGNIIKIDIL